MTLLRSLYAATLESPTVPISSPNIMEFLGAEASSASGKKVTEEGVLGLPAVWRAINVISGSCASLPLHAYKPGADSRERLTSGQAATLLEEPHPDMTPFELWETVFAHIGLWGNA